MLIQVLVDTCTEIMYELTRIKNYHAAEMTKTTNICKYWVSSRNRFCKFQVAKETDEYCAVHNVGTGDKERILCPVDPRHMIFKKDTEKHVLKCTKVIEDMFVSRQPFTSKGCNSVPVSTKHDIPADDSMFSDDELEKWRVRLSSSRSRLVSRIQSLRPDFIAVDESVSCTSDWSGSVEACVAEMTGGSSEARTAVDKHNLQNACLLQVLNQTGLAPTRTSKRIFVELGCGKAGLTRWLMYSLPEGEASPSDSPVFLLLDYEARRNKNENRKDLQSRVSSSNVVRLRSDIRDVDLCQFLTKKNMDEIPSIQGKPGSPEFRLSELDAKVVAIQARETWPYTEVVGTAKHLCGAATDFGLRALYRVRDRNVSLVFATCCHHRCDWHQLVSREVLEDLNACSSEQEFKRMISMAGWATTEGIVDSKRLLGRLVKSVIDLSRVLWLVTQFPNASLFEYRKYIEDGITPESFCIVMRSTL